MNARAVLANVIPRALACVLALAATGCVSAARGVSTRLAVSVHAGQPSVPTWPTREPRVEIVVDATSSMATSKAGAASAFEAARGRVLGWLPSLPADAVVRLHRVDRTDGSGALCAAGEGAVHSRSIETLDDARRLLTQPPRGEVDLGSALDAVAARLAGEGAMAGTRLVVASDLDARCLGDVCAAAERAVSAGASLDWIVLGEGAAPECLASVVAPRDAPTPLALQGRLAPPQVVVVPREAFLAGGAKARAASVSGAADGAPFEAPPGEVFVQVELTPRLVIGPVVLPPGGNARIDVLDFPVASPPQREWRIETTPGAARSTGRGDR